MTIRKERATPPIRKTLLRRACAALAATALAATAFGSCAARPISTGEEETATITINLGPVLPGATAKGTQDRGSYQDWPMGGLPVFSHAIVTVSGGGSTETEIVAIATASGATSGGKIIPEARITLEVASGDNRTVTVAAFPDWAATTATYQGIVAMLPTLATAYGAGATLDLPPGETVNLNLTLSAIGTRILIPNLTVGANHPLVQLDSVDQIPLLADGSLAGTGYTFSINANGNFAFDRFGRLFRGIPAAGIYRQGNLDATASLIYYDSISLLGALAVDTENGVLYEAYSSDGWSLGALDISSTATPLSVSMPPDISNYIDNAVATDSGAVFVSGHVISTEAPVILKLRCDFAAGTSTAEAMASFSAIGLETTEGTELTVADLTAQGGMLYIAAYQANIGDYIGGANLRSRGKILALRASDLSRVAEYGWTDGTCPADPDTASLLFGPRRFVGLAPGKLVFIDEGFWWDTSVTMNPAITNRDGIAVLNLWTGSITRRELTGFEFYGGSYTGFSIC